MSYSSDNTGDYIQIPPVRVLSKPCFCFLILSKDEAIIYNFLCIERHDYGSAKEDSSKKLTGFS